VQSADTNVLLRYLTGAPEELAERATAFLSDRTWVSHTVLLELYFVLTSKAGVYRRTRQQGLDALEGLIEDPNLQVDEPEIARNAVALAKANAGVSISECFILEAARRARRTGNLPLGTLDRRLGACTGARCLLDDR
jgi:predicted nucleic-acid-binding protein